MEEAGYALTLLPLLLTKDKNKVLWDLASISNRVHNAQIKE